MTTCYSSDSSSYSGTYGGMTTYSGTDSNGNYYSGSCSSYGGMTTCY